MGVSYLLRGVKPPDLPSNTALLCDGARCRLSHRADDFEEMLTSADESELDPLQWNDGKDTDKDAMSNSNALEFDDDAVEWSKDFDRDSASPTSRKRPSYVRCVVVVILVLLVIAGVCVAILLLHRRMQGALPLQLLCLVERRDVLYQASCQIIQQLLHPEAVMNSD